MKKIYLIVLAAVCLGSCTFNEIDYLDFSLIDSSDTRMFQPLNQCVTDLGNGMPESTVLPDGTPVEEYLAQESDATKATSTTLPAFLQQFMRWSRQKKVLEIAGVYQSVDENGDPLTLSGKIVLPADRKIKRVILVSHYTIGTDYEAPSNTFPLEGLLATLGYAVVEPDYIGYGATVDRPHPYLMMDVTATNVVDMYFAVMPFLEKLDITPEHPEIYLMGYSQGGGTTMAVQRLLEDYYSNAVSIKRVFAGGGIYDVRYTFENFIFTNWASYPCGVPFVLYGQVKGFHLDDSYFEKMLRPEIRGENNCNLNRWFVEKKTSTKQINLQIGTHVTDQILTEKAMTPSDYDVSTLYSMMTVNSVLAYAWTPKAPVFMMHSIDDDTVPYGNATKAQERWSNANIQYNFGHYGNHVMCCVRFIFTVKTLLEQSND